MDSEECTICLEPLYEVQKKITTLECRHSFHTKCFTQYVSNMHPNTELDNVGVDCPLCRSHVIITIKPDDRVCASRRSIIVATLLPVSAMCFMALYFFVLAPNIPH